MRISYFTCILKNCLYINKGDTIIQKACGSHTRSTFGDKVTRLSEKTLIGRMMVYLNNSNISKDTDGYLYGTNIIHDLIHGKRNCLRTLNVSQIENLFYSMNVNILRHSRENLRKILNILDIECCLRINSLDSKDILRLLNAYMHVIPNRITEYKFYQYVTDDIDRYLISATKKELLQFIFYIGLQKRLKKSQSILKKCLNVINKYYLENLSIEDLCIICNSLYRTNTKVVNTQLLDKIKQTLNENLSLLKDPTLLVTLIKMIRQNNYQDDDILTTISCTIFFNNTIQYYSFPAIGHILSLFAGCLYYDEELLKLLVQKGITQLRESKDPETKYFHLSQQLRAKDITSFLKAVAILGFTELDKDTLENIFVPKIKQRLAINEYGNDLVQLLDAIFYLWMLNCHPTDLVKYSLTEKNVSLVKDSPTKVIDRINLLLTIIKCEDENLYGELNIKPTRLPNFNQNLQIQNRPTLSRIFQMLKTSSLFEPHEFVLQTQIPHLNIVGILQYGDSKLNIELLDDYTCVKNKDCHPSGFMQLKLRILEESKVPLLILYENEIISMNDSELEEYLKNEINLVC